MARAILVVFDSATFGASFALFWALRGYFLSPLGLLLRSGSGSKTFLESINVDYQFLFWKCSPIFCKIWDNFALFGPFGAIFLVVVRFRNFFGTYLCRQSTLVFDVQPFHFVFNSDTFGATFALFSGPSGGYFFGLFKLFFCGLGQVRKYFWNLPK